ncbi:hypothetical protein [Nocardioides sp.]|uniref:hypothetical protein n=1 Tax=Nocardioides sp. TaxID=35761 RepID=UPI002728CD89|nr:hypothetical protein [Nocardioides sp.]MDO9457038.1 hypothetical protein [Nocardioides sp.]
MAVGITSTAALVQTVEGHGSPATTTSPAVPPTGGFAVPADRMDETLLELLDPSTGASAQAVPRGEQTRSLREPGRLRRAVQTGAVLLATPGGPALVRVEVRRATASECVLASCVEVVRATGAAPAPPSVTATVVSADVEVRAQAWAGPHSDGPPTLARPPLTAEALVRLAGDPVWRR